MKWILARLHGVRGSLRFPPRCRWGQSVVGLPDSVIARVVRFSPIYDLYDVGALSVLNISLICRKSPQWAPVAEIQNRMRRLYFSVSFVGYSSDAYIPNAQMTWSEMRIGDPATGGRFPNAQNAQRGY